MLRKLASLHCLFPCRFLLAGALLLSLLCSPGVASAKDLVLGFVPGECQLFDTTEQADQFAAYLSSHLDQPIRTRAFKDETNLQHWMNRFREVDLAVMSRDHIAENGKGYFIPLSEYLLSSSEEFGKGMVVGRRGLSPKVFVKIKQSLLDAATDSSAAGLLGSLKIAGFVVPRQPKVDYTKTFIRPARKTVSPQVKPKPIVQKKPPVVQAKKPQATALVSKPRQHVQVEILSPKDGGTTGPQPLLQYYLKNARAAIQLDGQPLSKGPGDRLGPLRDGPHELLFEITSPIEKPSLRKIRFQVDATPPDLSIESPRQAVAASGTTVHGSREADAGVKVLNASGQSAGSVIFPTRDSWKVQLSQLHQGENRFQVVARDHYGNEQRQALVLEVDAIPPAVAIIAPADGSIVTTTPALAFSADEGEVVVLVDGQPVENINRSLDSLDDGLHVVVVRVRDAAGNIGEARSRFEVDRSGPGLSVEPVKDVIGRRQATLRGTREADSKLALSLEPASLSAQLHYPDPTSWQIDVDHLVEGKNVVSVQARDAAGNLTSEEVVLQVDLTAPVVRIVAPVAGSVHSESPTFIYEADSESVQVLLDDVPLTLISGAPLPVMVDGPHVLVVTAADAAGNTGISRVSFEVDRTAPALELVSPIGGLSNDPNPVLEIRGEDDFEVYLDGQQSTVASGERLGPLEDGEHHLRLVAIDRAGNRQEIERTLLIDTTPPGWEILSGLEASSISSRQLSGRREAGIDLEFSSETATFAEIQYPDAEHWSVVLSGLAEGDNRINVSAVDPAGNSRSSEIVLLLDSKPPELIVDSPLADTVYGQSPELAYQVDEGVVLIKLNAEDVELENGQPLPLTEDGRHLLLIQVTDRVGNQTVQVVPFMLDRQGPDLTADPLPAASSSEHLQLLGSSGVDSVVKVIDQNGKEACPVSRDDVGSWACTVGPFAEGPVSFQVVAVDQAGNESSLALSTTIDLTPPKLEWISPLPGVYQQFPSIDYSLDDGELSLLLDGTELAVDSDPAALNLTEGPHQLEVLATDQAGNQSRQLIAFTIDRQAPIVVLSQPAELVSESNPPFSFVANEGTIKVLLDGEPIEIEAGQALPSLSEGEHLIRVEALDEAGNLGVAERQFQVDTTGPQLTLNEAPSLTKNDQAILTGVTDGDLTATRNGVPLTVERLGGNDWQVSLTDLQQGINTVVLTATDQVGLQTEVRVEIERDSIPPELILTSPQEGLAYVELPMLNYTSDGSDVVVRLDSLPISVANGSPLPEMTDGEHELHIEATDQAGNLAEKSLIFVVDRQGPTLEVTPLPAFFNGEFLVLQGKVEPGVSLRVEREESEEGEACVVDVDPSGAWSCSVGPFEEGPLTYTVSAVDPAGNESKKSLETVIDRTPPVIDWRAPLPGPHVAVEALDFSISDGDLEILINGQPYNPADPLPDFSEGAHQIDIKAVDQAGNQTRQLIAFSIDRQGPLVVISQPADLVTDAQPVVSFVADRADVTIYLDGQQIEVDAGDRLPPLDDGKHLLRIEARDLLGNVGFAEQAFEVDTTRPELSLDAQPGPVAGSTVMLKGRAESSAVVSAEFEGRELAVVREVPDLWSLEVPGLKEGTNQIVVKATDQAGLQTGLNIQVIRDSEAPALQLLSPLAQTYTTDSLILDYQADSEPARLEVEVDGTLVEPGPDRKIGPLSEGEHLLVVRAWDLAGNQVEARQTFSIDMTPPAFFVDPLPETVSSATVLLSGTRDPGSFIDVIPPEGSIASLPEYPAENLWEIELTSVPDGVHDLHFTARDQHGNVGSQQAVLKVDSLEPVVRILSPTVGLFNNPRPELRIEGEGGELQALLNGEPVNVDTDRFATLDDGDYVLLVTETDEAGNVGRAKVEFKVDTTPPLVELISPAKGDRTSTTPTLAYQITGGDVTIQLDGQEITLPSGQSLPQLGEGEHIVRLTATDEAGNVATAQARFTVDSSAPQVILLSPASGLTPDSTPLLQFRVDRGDVRVLVDGVEVNKRSGSSLDPLDEGEHVVRVEAKGKSGNIGYAERRLVVSLAEPDIVAGSNLSDRFSEFSIQVEPAEVPVGYEGDIELRIGPLRKPGETIYIEQWVDSNGNGVADSGEQVARVFKLVDGLASPSRKVPGDMDGQADRMILVRLSLEELHQNSTSSVQYVLLAMGDSDIAEAKLIVVVEP